MREIKFRVWDERAKQYADTKKCVYIVGVLHNNKITLGFDSPKSEYSLGLVLEQFTGLLDKNGKEIYEGDIVDIHQTVNGINLFEIFWDKTKLNAYYVIPSILPERVVYQYDFNELMEIDIETTGYDKEIEIIGNIHDNPELLKGDNNV